MSRCLAGFLFSAFTPFCPALTPLSTIVPFPSKLTDKGERDEAGAIVTEKEMRKEWFRMVRKGKKRRGKREEGRDER